MSDEPTTNEQIALLVHQQTYTERMSFAEFFAGLDEHTAEYIAAALGDWADENEPKDED